MRRFIVVSPCRTGLSMMAALLPLRLLTIGSSCSTPSSERNLAAASPCIVWQDLAGKCLALSISIDANKLCRNPLFLSLYLPLLINWQRSLVIVPGRAGVDINIAVVSSPFSVWIQGMIVACEHIFPVRSSQAFNCTSDLVVLRQVEYVRVHLYKLRILGSGNVWFPSFDVCRLIYSKWVQWLSWHVWCIHMSPFLNFITFSMLVFKGRGRVIFQFKKAAIGIFMNVSYPTLLAFWPQLNKKHVPLFT